MIRTLPLNSVETKRLAELLLLHEKAERDLKVGLTLLLASREIEDAMFVSLAGQELAVEVP